MPTLELIAGGLGQRGTHAVEQVCERLRAGDFDDVSAPARLHGDLWSGNVLWSPDGAVLIDPCAQGGHPLTDLAALALFGCPQLEEIYAGYESVRSLPDGWHSRIGLHQLSMLLTHVYLFGSSYVGPTVRTALEYCR